MKLKYKILNVALRVSCDYVIIYMDKHKDGIMRLDQGKQGRIRLACLKNKFMECSSKLLKPNPKGLLRP